MTFFLTGKEFDKLKEFETDVDKAFWRVWGGKAYFDGVAVKENLKRAKKILEELGI